MKRWRRDTTFYALILLLAVAARLGGACWWESRLPDGTDFRFGDSQTYWLLARTIAQDGFEKYAWDERQCTRTPGYPLLLAPLFAWSEETVSGEPLSGKSSSDEQSNEMDSGPSVSGPSAFWGRMISVLFGTLAVAGVMGLAHLLFNKPTALLAGLITAVYPGAIAMSSLVLTEAPFTALMLLQIILWLVGWRSTGNRRFLLWMLAAGIVAGVATLVRPSWLLFTPGAIAAAVLFCQDRRRHALGGVCLMVGFCLTMAPWWVRNYQLYGQFVPTTLQVGASLYDGLSPQADGSSNMDFVEPITNEFRKQQQTNQSAEQPQSKETFEFELNQEFRSRATTWARENPGATLQLAGTKFLRTWNVWPNEPSFRSLPLRLAVLATYGPVLVLALIGTWHYARRGWPFVLCLLPVAYFSLLHMIFVGSIRYRQPVMPLLIMLAAAVIIDWATNRRRVASEAIAPRNSTQRNNVTTQSLTPDP